MTRLAELLRRFAVFWWDFLIGDDWRIAVGVIAALAFTAALGAAGVPAWWLLPVAVIAVLGASLRRATRPPQ